MSDLKTEKRLGDGEEISTNLNRTTPLVDKISFLSTTPLFTDVDKEVIAKVSQYFFEKPLKKGERVNKEGGKARALYFVVDGTLKSYKTSSDDKEQILDVFRPGDFFGATVLDEAPNPASVKALGTSMLYGIQKTHLRTITRRYPQISANLVTMLSQRIRRFISIIEDLSFRSVSSRVAKILLENDKIPGGARLTQSDIAAIAGTVREVVSRSLRYLDDNKLIEMRRRQIVIVDIEGLRGVADDC